MKNFKLSYTRIQQLAEQTTRNKSVGYVSNEAIYNAIIRALTEERMMDKMTEKQLSSLKKALRGPEAQSNLVAI